MQATSTHAEQARRYREQRNARGICWRCTRPVAPGKRQCQFHLDEQRERYASRAAEGKCGCGAPRQDGRSSCLRCLDLARKATARRSEAWKEQGLCRLCGAETVPERTMCAKHLVGMRLRAHERNRERQAAGLCRQCARPSELGQVMCLAHRQVSSETSLPNPVRRALKNYRQIQEQATRDAEARSAREFIDRHLYLIRKDRDREMLRMRYGFTEDECMTLEQVGQQFGITRERVRQIQERSEEMIRMFTIEQNIPIPPAEGHDFGKEVGDTLDAMSVGDSFLVPLAKRNKLSAFANKRGYIITTRKAADDQARVWLVSKNGHDASAGRGDNNQPQD